MQSASEIRRAAFAGDYLPRKCAIATFTPDSGQVRRAEHPNLRCFVVPANDMEEGYDYPSEVSFEIEEQNLASYHQAADFLNMSNVDVVSLQHEFGIFGGPAGSHIVPLIRALKM